MNELLQIWNTIVQTNTFNFIVMAIILSVILKKVNIASVIDKSIQNVVETIEKSKTEKLSARKKLDEANELIKNLESDISSQLSLAEEQGQQLHDNIISDTENKIININANIQRVVEAEEQTLSAALTRKTAAEAVNIAQNHIKNVLNRSPELHDKYICESIEELDRIEL